MRALWMVVIMVSAAPLAAQPGTPTTVALDASFGKGGFVIDHLDVMAQTSDLGRWLTVDREGRPVVGGNSTGQRFCLGRYTKDGRPDSSFAGRGKTAICIEDQSIVESAGDAEVQFTHSGVIDPK